MNYFHIVALLAVLIAAALLGQVCFAIHKKKKQLQYVYPSERKTFQQRLVIFCSTLVISLLSLAISFIG